MNIQQLQERLTQVSQGVFYSSEGEEPIEVIVYKSSEREGEISLEALLSTSSHLSTVSLERLQLATNEYEKSQRLYDAITTQLSDVRGFMLQVPDGDEMDPDCCKLENLILLGQFSDDAWIAITPNREIDEDNFSEDDAYSIDLDDSTNPEVIAFVSHLEKITTGFNVWKESWESNQSPDWLVITAPHRQGLIDKVIEKTRLIHHYPVTNLKKGVFGRLLVCSSLAACRRAGERARIGSTVSG
jgi:hypothetical protein